MSVYSLCVVSYYFLAILSSADAYELNVIAVQMSRDECKELLLALVAPEYDNEFFEHQIMMVKRGIPDSSAQCLDTLLTWPPRQDKPSNRQTTSVHYEQPNVKRKNLLSKPENLSKRKLRGKGGGYFKRHNKLHRKHTRSIGDDDYWKLLDTIGLVLLCLTTVAAVIILALRVREYSCRFRRSKQRTMMCKLVEYYDDGTFKEIVVAVEVPSSIDIDKAMKSLKMKCDERNSPKNHSASRKSEHNEKSSPKSRKLEHNERDTPKSRKLEHNERNSPTSRKLEHYERDTPKSRKLEHNERDSPKNHYDSRDSLSMEESASDASRKPRKIVSINELETTVHSPR